MRKADERAEPPYIPGERVTVTWVDAQVAVGGTHGIVVGSTGATDGAGPRKVVVALAPPCTHNTENAVIAAADLEIDTAEASQ